jgi:hypothetical protein
MLITTDVLAHGKDIPDIDIVMTFLETRIQVSFFKWLEEQQERWSG